EARAHGDLRRARSLHEEGLAIQRELGHKGSMVRSLCHLGAIAAIEADPERARLRYQESLSLGVELGDKRSIAACLEGLAGLGVGGWAGTHEVGGGVGNGIIELPAPNPQRPTPNAQRPTPLPQRAARLLGSAA